MDDDEIARCLEPMGVGTLEFEWYELQIDEKQGRQSVQ
jgi:hypothetical protein